MNRIAGKPGEPVADVCAPHVSAPAAEPRGEAQTGALHAQPSSPAWEPRTDAPPHRATGEHNQPSRQRLSVCLFCFVLFF